jgi:hypothetical protein
MTWRASSISPYLRAVIATVMEIVGLHSSRLKLNVGYHAADGVPEVVLGDAMRVQQAGPSKSSAKNCSATLSKLGTGVRPG